MRALGDCIVEGVAALQSWTPCQMAKERAYDRNER